MLPKSPVPANAQLIPDAILTGLRRYKVVGGYWGVVAGLEPLPHTTGVVVAKCGAGATAGELLAGEILNNTKHFYVVTDKVTKVTV